MSDANPEDAALLATSWGLFSIRGEETAIFWILNESIGLSASTLCNSSLLLLTADADVCGAMVSQLSRKNVSKLSQHDSEVLCSCSFVDRADSNLACEKLAQ
jgi:hypothetical protein